HVHQAREGADLNPRRRARRGVPGASVAGVLPRPEDAGRDVADDGLSRRGPYDLPARASPGRGRALGGVVRPVPGGGSKVMGTRANQHGGCTSQTGTNDSWTGSTED